MHIVVLDAQRHACSTAHGHSIGSATLRIRESGCVQHSSRSGRRQQHPRRGSAILCSVTPAVRRSCHGAATALAMLLAASPASSDVAELFTRNCAGELWMGASCNEHADCANCPAEVHPILQTCTACTGCHAGGGNVIQAGASLSTGDLRQNGVEDPKALFDLIYGGKGRMPGYGESCAPKVRLHRQSGGGLCSSCTLPASGAPSGVRT